MTLRVDDMKVGHWVVVVEKITVDERFAMTYTLNGRPWEILAINLPFIAVLSGDCLTSFDVREYRFERCNRRYAEIMLQAADQGSKIHHYVERREKRKKGTVDASGVLKRCVNCAERLRQRLDKATRKWCWVCPRCDRTVGEVQK